MKVYCGCPIPLWIQTASCNLSGSWIFVSISLFSRVISPQRASGGGAFGKCVINKSMSRMKLFRTQLPNFNSIFYPIVLQYLYPNTLLTLNFPDSPALRLFALDLRESSYPRCNSSSVRVLLVKQMTRCRILHCDFYHSFLVFSISSFILWYATLSFQSWVATAWTSCLSLFNPFQFLVGTMGWRSQYPVKYWISGRIRQLLDLWAPPEYVCGIVLRERASPKGLTLHIRCSEISSLQSNMRETQECARISQVLP